MSNQLTANCEVCKDIYHKSINAKSPELRSGRLLCPRCRHKEREAGITKIVETIGHFLGSIRNPEDDPNEKQSFVVIGGAALFLLGYRDAFDDIDLIVPSMTGIHNRVTEHKGTRVDSGCEYWLDGKNLTKEVTSRTIPVLGMDVMASEDILEQKLFLNRDKDQADISLLKAHGCEVGWRHMLCGFRGCDGTVTLECSLMVTDARYVHKDKVLYKGSCPTCEAVHQVEQPNE
jgi:hypothetical protein